MHVVAGRGEGRDSQPSPAQPNSWRGAHNTNIELHLQNYIYALYKETGKEKGCGEAEGQGVDVDIHSLFHLLFHKGLLSTCCIPGRRREGYKRAQKVTCSVITNNLFVY